MVQRIFSKPPLPLALTTQHVMARISISYHGKTRQRWAFVGAVWLPRTAQDRNYKIPVHTNHIPAVSACDRVQAPKMMRVGCCVDFSEKMDQKKLTLLACSATSIWTTCCLRSHFVQLEKHSFQAFSEFLLGIIHPRSSCRVVVL